MVISSMQLLQLLFTYESIGTGTISELIESQRALSEN